MDLNLTGRRVTAQEVGHTVALTFSGGVEVRVETPLALPDLIGRVVAGAHADDGGLRVDFQDGSRPLVAADPEYEAWTVAGPDGREVVSGPGGGLAIWSGAGEDA